MTGPHDELADTLAAHADVDAFWWPAASQSQAQRVQALSASNLERSWVGEAAAAADLRAVLDQAVQVKNIWVPHGV